MSPSIKFTGKFDVNERVWVFHAGSWRKGSVLEKTSQEYTNGTIEKYKVKVDGLNAVIPANNFGAYGLQKISS